MKLIIIGCGRVGTALAHAVTRKDHQVVVIDRDPQAFQSLGPDFQGRTVQGDVRNREVLRRAGIEEADGFAAITSNDEMNMVAAFAAREFFNVPNVVARVDNPNHAELFSLANLPTVIASSWSANRIEQILIHPGLTELADLGNGQAAIIEVLVPDHLIGKKLAYIAERGRCQPSIIMRGGSAILAEDELILEDCDLIVVAILGSHLPHLESLLRPEEN
jgi:trk system potassium uptake protein TrkA